MLQSPKRKRSLQKNQRKLNLLLSRLLLLPKQPKASGNAGELWSKILKAATPSLSPGVAPLFGSVKAELSDNILSLSSENSFAMQMLKKSENMEILRKSTESVAPGTLLTAGGVSVPVPETSGIDELLEGLGDFDGVTIK